MMTQGRPLLRVQNVSKKYGRGREATLALDNISLDVQEGELLAITGPSGSGKTTLTHIIGGLTSPDSGSVIFRDVELKSQNDAELSKYRNSVLGFVFQNFSLIPYFTALENVCIPLTARGVAVRARRDYAKELLRSVGLEKRLNKRADTLSGGERQRVAIARALATNPKIIIADEPTGSLDSKRGAEIMDMLESLTRTREVTIIMVTHDPVLAARADRIIHIRDGHVAERSR